MCVCVSLLCVLTVLLIALLWNSTKYYRAINIWHITISHLIVFIQITMNKAPFDWLRDSIYLRIVLSLNNIFSFFCEWIYHWREHVFQLLCCCCSMVFVRCYWFKFDGILWNFFFFFAFFSIIRKRSTWYQIIYIDVYTFWNPLIFVWKVFFVDWALCLLTALHTAYRIERDWTNWMILLPNYVWLNLQMDTEIYTHTHRAIWKWENETIIKSIQIQIQTQPPLTYSMCIEN